MQTQRISVAFSARIFLAALVPLVLTACFDSEPKERKAFIEFLQTRVLDRPGLRVPKPSAEQQKEFGRYAAHYAVISDFHDSMDKQVSEPMQKAAKSGMIFSVDQLLARRADLVAARDGMAQIRGALDGAVEKANAARDALQQPDDLKAVYAQVYEKVVLKLSETMQQALPPAEESMNVALQLADFVEQNKDKIKINGIMVQVEDAGLLAQFKALQDELEAKGRKTAEAQQQMRNLIYGTN